MIASPTSRHTATCAALIAGLAITLHAYPATAATSLERLVMPGPLTDAHADLEHNCKKCHTPFSRDTQEALCRNCHERIEEDVKTRSGYHGRLADTAGSLRCALCHAEHNGRSADIMKLDRDTFEHTRTDFPLKGAHILVSCSSCHLEDHKRRDAGSDCVDCHRVDDHHGSHLGNQCADCHDEIAWEAAQFDHSTTEFALVGAHRNTACSSCHKTNRYNEAPRTCLACHRQDDVHQARHGEDCRKCHNAQSWSNTSFDHAEDTGFALAGRHAALRCNHCHTEIGKKNELSTACVDCHRAGDVHQKSLGVDCAKCHTAEGWLAEVRFDHELTRFPLVGLHGSVACEQCHLTQKFADAPLACIECHAADDAHEGVMGPACADCHNPNEWDAWIFEHEPRTGYRLDGAHEGLQCKACHTRDPVSRVIQPNTCNACHSQDDVHAGRFGIRCTRCHTTESFKGAVVH